MRALRPAPATGSHAVLMASEGDDDRGEAAREERGKHTMWWGRADGGVICVGCGRWGKHGCVSVLSDASRSVRNQFRAGLGRHAYSNWILLLTISFTCSVSVLLWTVWKSSNIEEVQVLYTYTMDHWAVWEVCACVTFFPLSSLLPVSLVWIFALTHPACQSCLGPRGLINNHNC